MTVPYFKHFQLLFLLAIPLAKVAASQHDFVVDAVPSLIRGGSMEEELDAHGRQLSSSLSWSWTNLLFHLGVCHASDSCPSEKHIGPCGCPDCHKPHPPHFQNSYCENLATASETSEEATDTEDYGEDSSNGTGQNARRTLKIWMVIAAAATVVAAAGAVIMRKREGATTLKNGSTRELSAAAANGSDYKLMGGMTAAFAGVMAKMGLKQSSGEDSSTTSGSSGIVSKRLSLLKNGGDVSPMDRGAQAPSFIEIQTDLDADHDMMIENESIEVEGPYRPSSQYAI